MKKQIKQLLADIADVKYDSRFAEIEVGPVEHDSRKCGPGSFFVAVEGYESDGHRYIDSAVESGAAAVAVSSARQGEFARLEDKGVALIAADDTRYFLSAVSSAFYGYPSKKMKVIGITGTNGKTSITYMLESILKEAGYNPGVIGTVNHRWAGKTRPAATTTPESLELQGLLFEMQKDGVDSVVMEVSSHALALFRADYIDFDCAVFTNLTGDHLDFHQDMKSYLEAKKRLFHILSRSSKKNRYAVINMDDPAGREIYEQCRSLSVSPCGFGIQNVADYYPLSGSIENRIDGVSYKLQKPESLNVTLTLAGRFHVYNSLASIAAARVSGADFNAILSGLSKLKNVPGRFDTIVSEEGFSTVIDYAHTPDALLKLLESVREVTRGRVITVVGCGGDRDKTKRPVMGEISDTRSDLVIVTSDNPRTEDPALIIKDILAGIKRADCLTIQDRETAIKTAVYEAEEGDTIVIAGKGHEDYQILGREKIHFDDKETALKYINERKANES